jgi:hypothetical protein
MDAGLWYGLGFLIVLVCVFRAAKGGVSLVDGCVV